MRKFKYFMNGFQFQYLFFSKCLSKVFDFELKVPDALKFVPGYSYIPRNLFLLNRLYSKGWMDKYDVVQFNNTENFLNFRSNPNQISIAESHGFDFGVNYSRYLEDEKNPFKYFLGWSIDKILGARIRKKIQEFDLYYCSTPDMREPLARLVRADVQWLPNPIDTAMFAPEGKILKLEGTPSFFFPTRLHGDKKPEIAIEIFKNRIKPLYPNATLHLLEWGYEVPKYKKLLNDPETYFWHGFMDKEMLAAKIRWSDFCFGDFSIGGLSLMPMQIMACKKPIVTYDQHELVKVPREDLAAYAMQMLESENFKNEQVQKNYNYVVSVHSEEAVCRKHMENLKPFMKSKLRLSDEEIEALY